jgi:hypothetical protein
VDLPVPVPPTKITMPRLCMPQVAQDRGQLQLFDGGDAGLDATQDHAGLVALHEGADAEAPGAAGVDRELALVGLSNSLQLLGRHQILDRLLGLLGGQRLGADGSDDAVDLDARRSAGGDEQVRAPSSFIMLSRFLRSIVI